MGLFSFITTTQFFLYGKRYCTQTGWQAAHKVYEANDILESDMSLEGKVYIVTGANAGIGLGITEYLAKKQATVYMVCRNAARAEASQKKLVENTLNNNIHVLVADCGEEADVRRMWSEFEAKGKDSSGHLKLDGVVCNAGALSNTRTSNSAGIESTFATHLLFGTYLLVELAIPTLKLNPSSRVVAVSSGGMYNSKFPKWSIATNQEGAYDGQLQYVYAKRGQVLLCEEWTKRHPEVTFVSCHPGWVDTGGVDAAYGKAKSYLQPLRTIWEGVEGIIWLLVVPDPKTAVEGGGYYLDRTSCVKHLSGPFFSEGSHTKNTPAEVTSMMDQLHLWSNSATRPPL